GAHARVITSDSSESGSYTGGNGGNGGDTCNGCSVGNGSGGGGAAGFGIVANGSGINLSVEGTALIRGGNGGNGGFARAGAVTSGGGSGNGGEGGIGLFFTSNGTLDNSGRIVGGNGGNAGNASDLANRGANGAGGAGVAGANLFITNTGTITGGNAGNLASPFNTAAGAGITGSDLTIINIGTINAGIDSLGTRGDAIAFTGGSNILELYSGFLINGNVIAFSAADTLRLGGTVDDTFDVSTVGTGAQYQGFGNFEKTGSSTWTLSGTTTAITPWTIYDGILVINSAQALGDDAGTLTILNGARLAVTAPMTISQDMVLGSGGGVIDFGLAVGAPLVTIAGAISGTSLTKLGVGELQLTAANTYTGGTTITDGTLRLSGAGELSSSGTIDIAAGATFAIDQTSANGGNYTFANPLTGSGLLSVALQNGSNSFDFTGTTGSVFTGTLALGNSSFDLSGSNTTALSQATLELGAGNVTTIGVGDQAVGNLTFNGGTARFANLPTGQVTTGALALDAGAVQVDPTTAADSLGSLLQQDEGAQERLVAASSVTGVAANLSLIDLSGAALSTAAVNILQGGNIVAIGDYGYALTNDVTGLFINVVLTQLALQDNQTLTLSGDSLTPAGANNMTALLTGSGNLAIDATSLIELNNSSNDYTGTTTVVGGTLLLGSDNVLGNTSQLAINTGTTADINGFTQSVGSLAGAGLLAISGGNLTVTDGGLFSGVVSGTTGSLTAATGTLVLTGANSYSGVTAVDSGATLQIGNGGTDGSYAGNISNAGLVLFDRTDAASYAGVISGNGSLTQSGSGTLTLTGVNSYSGGTSVANGTLRLTGSGAINASSAVDIAAGATFAIDQTSTNGGNYSFANPLTGAGVLSVALQNGSNSFDFTGTTGSDFTGTLALGTSNFDLSGTNTAALSQATLELGAGNVTTIGVGDQAVGSLTFNGGTARFANLPTGQVTTGALALDAGTVQVDSNGVADSTGNLLQQDDGVLQQLVTATNVTGAANNLSLTDLTGTALSTAAVNILQGGNTVAIGDYGYALASDTSGLFINVGLTQLALQDNQTLTLSGDSLTPTGANNMTALLTGSGNLAIEATTLIELINSSNNYTGTTTVTGGTLLLGSDNALGNTRQLAINANTTADINGFTQTVGSLAGAGLLAISGGNLTVTDGGLFSGVVSGTTGTLTASNGTLVLTGANSYSGVTAVDSGATLQIGNG
ncbi:autotransporter-associated beta strand repeat-containing protein, partial [Serratia sp. DD3]|uniref:autotransporter-associated beta strand repeat-containing protein n=1 Tax=Serratia sp. DD3 TaxID=1410619 RepID=UPI00190F7086